MTVEILFIVFQVVVGRNPHAPLFESPSCTGLPTAHVL